MLSWPPCVGFSVVPPLNHNGDDFPEGARPAFRRSLPFASGNFWRVQPGRPRPNPRAQLGVEERSLDSPSPSGTSHPSSRPTLQPLYLQVVLPTPPLPPTKIHLRLRCSMMLLSVGSSGSTSGASSNSSASTPQPATPAAILEPAHVIERSAPRKVPTGEILCYIPIRASNPS